MTSTNWGEWISPSYIIRNRKKYVRFDHPFTGTTMHVVISTEIVQTISHLLRNMEQKRNCRISWSNKKKNVISWWLHCKQKQQRYEFDVWPHAIVHKYTLTTHMFGVTQNRQGRLAYIWGLRWSGWEPVTRNKLNECCCDGKNQLVQTSGADPKK